MLSIVIVGAFGIVTLWDKTNRDVVTVMNLTTEAKANEMDLALLNIRDAVDTIGAYIGARVVSTNQQLDEDVIFRSLEEEIHELFESAAEKLDGAVGYYIQFEPPYDSLVNGFAVQKNNAADASASSSEMNSSTENTDSWFSNPDGGEDD